MSEVEVGSIKVRILEAIPINFADRRSYLLSLQIVDGNYVSPVVRKEVENLGMVPRIVTEFVEYYKQIRDVVKSSGGSYG